MAVTSVAITAGSGTPIEVYNNGAGNDQQIIRKAKASAVTHGSWAITATGQASQVGADDGRVAVVFTNDSGSATVYLRFDATLPTSSAYHVKLLPGDYYEVPEALCTRAISVLGSVASGNLLYALGTAT